MTPLSREKQLLNSFLVRATGADEQAVTYSAQGSPTGSPLAPGTRTNVSASGFGPVTPRDPGGRGVYPYLFDTDPPVGPVRGAFLR